MNKFVTTLITITVSIMLGACSPKTGSKAWCENMADKAKGDWTTSEAGQFAKHCVLGNYIKD